LLASLLEVELDVVVPELLVLLALVDEVPDVPDVPDAPVLPLTYRDTKFSSHALSSSGVAVVVAVVEAVVAAVELAAPEAVAPVASEPRLEPLANCDNSLSNHPLPL
jgi:hypothetical protein